MTSALPPFAAWLAATVLPLGAAWLLFQLVLRSERCFGYNRAVLLLAPLVAALLPLLPRPELPAWPAGPGVAVAGPVSSAGVSVLLPALEATGGVGAAGWGGWSWLAALYGAGVALGLARLGGQLWHLRRAARELPREERAGYALVYTGGQLPTSSFGRTIFWDETAHLTAAEAESVLAHELAHVRQGHTYDVLWLEVWRAVLWPNPFAYLLLPALRLTHELLADRAAAAVAAPPTPLTSAEVPYSALLARLTAQRLAGPAYSTLLQPFTFSSTLTRIAMLQNQTPVRRWKQWLALPMLAGLLVVAGSPVSAQTVLGKNASAAERQTWKEQVMRNVKKALHDDSLATGGKRNPDRAWHLDIKRDATVEFRYQDSPPPPPKLMLSPDVFVGFIEGDGSGALIPRRIAEVAERMAQEHSEPDKPTGPNGPKVYTFVEQMPELPSGGGNVAIIQAIQDKLIYPKADAGSAAPEGRVFVSFTVNADGAVRDIKIVKGLASVYDAAVVAAVQQLPRFNPGRQSGKAVAVSFTVPVQFKVK
ncbi:TonB family protein [uncultured Hymenobacter sp.]|uniref:TonB family protein n=1 Tax=uncultured Hymenobacter sp. TaxID=170016 RepID=UPI0035CB2F89